MANDRTKTRGAIRADIELLTGNCAGPDGVKLRLNAWAGGFAKGDPEAEDIQRVKQTVSDLSILAHANAAFRLVPQRRPTTAPPLVEIDDLGGYSFARLIIADVIRTLPWPEDRRRELARFCIASAEGHVGQVRDRIVRDFGM